MTDYKTFSFITTVRTGILVAIDGYSSCGKSTLATDLAAALGYVHIDSGAMYRAVTLYFIRHDIRPEDEEGVAGALQRIRIGFSHEDGRQCTLLNGEDVSEEIRSHAVNKLVSPVAAISAVRTFLVAQQKALGTEGSVVMDGRDIGTVVFPHAELKIFLTANQPIRVERRFQELREMGVETTREEVAESLAYRDLIDTTREDSPLWQAEDAVVIDNSHLTREEQLRIAIELAQERIGSGVRSSPPQ